MPLHFEVTLPTSGNCIENYTIVQCEEKKPHSPSIPTAPQHFLNQTTFLNVVICIYKAQTSETVVIVASVK
jgi:hypothetical protein